MRAALGTPSWGGLFDYFGYGIGWLIAEPFVAGFVDGECVSAISRSTFIHEDNKKNLGLEGMNSKSRA